LPGHGQWQLVDDLDPRGLLEPGQADGAVVAHGGGELAGAVLRGDDVGDHGLAGRGVLDADDGSLGHPADLADDLLDLDRVDVDPGDDDELLDPVHQEQVTGGVEEADVAGAPPAVRVRAALAVGPVAAEDVVAADPDLAGVVTLRGVPELVAQGDLDPGQG